MKTTAAVLVELGRPLELADLDLPALKPGQVLVEVAFSGVCHTQLLEARGHRGPDRFLPHCLGHEGSGIVRETGAGVAKVKPGDAVILSWIKGTGADVPGSVYGWNGRTVNAGAITTFGTHSIISENRLTPISPRPLDAARGARWLRRADRRGRGLQHRATTTGAKHRRLWHWRHWFVRDRRRDAVRLSSGDCRGLNADKLALARQLGATAHINPRDGDVVEWIREFVSGRGRFRHRGDRHSAVMRQALACVRPQGGTAVIVGNAKHGQMLEIDPRELNQGKRLLGTWGGDNHPGPRLPALRPTHRRRQVKRRTVVRPHLWAAGCERGSR